MANLNAPAVLASGTGTALAVTDDDIPGAVTGTYLAADGNPDSARVFASDLARVFLSGTEPGVTAQGDDRDHE